MSKFEDLFYCFVAGLFADILSFLSLGMSFILFLALNIALKKALNSLKQKKDRRPLVYFTPLFLVFFITYNIIYGIIGAGQDMLTGAFLIKIIYNLIFAALGFYIYKFSYGLQQQI